VARGGLGRLRERDGRGSLGVDPARARLGDGLLPIQERDRIAVAPDRERALERRREPQRDLDLVGVDERRQPAGRVAAVRGRQRTAVPVGDGDLDPRVLSSEADLGLRPTSA
jgi:hypothetical protein